MIRLLKIIPYFSIVCLLSCKHTHHPNDIVPPIKPAQISPPKKKYFIHKYRLDDYYKIGSTQTKEMEERISRFLKVVGGYAKPEAFFTLRGDIVIIRVHSGNARAIEKNLPSALCSQAPGSTQPSPCVRIKD